MYIKTGRTEGIIASEKHQNVKRKYKIDDASGDMQEYFMLLLGLYTPKFIICVQLKLKVFIHMLNALQPANPLLTREARFILLRLCMPKQFSDLTKYRPLSNVQEQVRRDKVHLDCKLEGRMRSTVV